MTIPVNLEIFNVKNTSTVPYAFRDYYTAKERDFKFSDYKSVLSCKNFTEVSEEGYDEAIHKLLDELLVMFNDLSSESVMGLSFTGHKLSISDIVRVNDDFFYRDLFCWQKI